MSTDIEVVKESVAEVAVGAIEVVEAKVPLDLVEAIMKEIHIDGAPTLIGVVRQAMEVVETKPIKGVLQRDTVIEVVKSIVQSSSALDEATKASYLATVNSPIINDTIELVVDASKGRLNINVAKDVAECCLKSCLTAILKKK